MVAEKVLIFSEEQRLPGWLCWLLVFCIALMLFLPWYLIKKQDQSLPSVAAAMMIVVPIAVAILFRMAKLETQVCSDGLYVRLFPFQIYFKKYVFEDFSQYYACEYRPILEYGGWGIRGCIGKNGKAYNIKGNRGMQIIFKDGKKLLIGSQNPQELIAAMDSVVKNKM